jgi:hypothetical protein
MPSTLDTKALGTKKTVARSLPQPTIRGYGSTGFLGEPQIALVVEVQNDDWFSAV